MRLSLTTSQNVTAPKPNASLIDKIFAVNPEDDPNNCIACALAFECQMRGRNIIARTEYLKPRNYIEGGDLFGSWLHVFAKRPDIQYRRDLVGDSFKKDIIDYLDNIEGDARVIVRVKFDDDATISHVFNGIKIDNNIMFIDTQNRLIDCSIHFQEMVRSDTLYMRVDNLEFTDALFDLVKEPPQ